MSSSRRPTAMSTARANALQLLMDKARARAGKPPAASAAAGDAATPHTPTKRKLVSRAQREAGSVQSSPHVDDSHGHDVKAEPEQAESDGQQSDVDELSPISSKRRRLDSDSSNGDGHDPSLGLVHVKSEACVPAVTDDWLAFGDDAVDTTSVKQEPTVNGSSDEDDKPSPASSPTRARRRLRTKSAMERKAQQDRQEALALADEFDVDEENIIESPRKSRRGGIRDRIQRARNRGELSLDTSDRLPATVTMDDSDDSDNDGTHAESHGSDSDDLIIVSKADPASSVPRLDLDSDASDQDQDDSWIVNDDEGADVDDDVEGAPDTVPLAFHNLDNLQWYTLYLEYLARLAMDPNTHRRLLVGIRRPGEPDDPLAAAYRKVKDMIQLRLKSMYSTVWPNHLLETIHAHPLCRRTANPAQDLCEACNRAERNTCARLTFRGNAYDPTTFRPAPPDSDHSDSDDDDDETESPAPRRHRRRIASDSESGSDLEVQPTSQSNVRTLARALVSPHYSVGRFCALRVQGYHQLHHAMYHTYLTVRERMAHLAGVSVFGGEWPSGRISVEEGDLLLESLLTGPEAAKWIKDRYSEFNGMLADADDVLCNRVGALSKFG